jgi:hypothetical protein
VTLPCVGGAFNVMRFFLPLRFSPSETSARSHVTFWCSFDVSYRFFVVVKSAYELMQSMMASSPLSLFLPIVLLMYLQNSV